MKIGIWYQSSWRNSERFFLSENEIVKGVRFLLIGGDYESVCRWHISKITIFAQLQELDAIDGGPRIQYYSVQKKQHIDVFKYENFNKEKNRCYEMRPVQYYSLGCVWNFQIGRGCKCAIFQYDIIIDKLKLDLVLYFGLIDFLTVAKILSWKNGF